MSRILNSKPLFYVFHLFSITDFMLNINLVQLGAVNFGIIHRSSRYLFAFFIVPSVVSKQTNHLNPSLQNRRYFFAFYFRRARSARHTRREGREKKNACTPTIVHAIPAFIYHERSYPIGSLKCQPSPPPNPQVARETSKFRVL